VRCLILSALLFAASIILKAFPLILITAPVLAFFSVLTSLHFIFYLRRRERCIKRVSGESRRRFISTALKLVAGLALYSIIGRIPLISARPEPVKSAELSGKDLEEVARRVFSSTDLINVISGFKTDFRDIKAARHVLSINDKEVALLAVAMPVGSERVVTYYEYSEPVNHVKTQACLFRVEGKRVVTERVSINGYLVATDTVCPSYCSSDNDCPPGYYCHIYCCDFSLSEAIDCCHWCEVPCHISAVTCIACLSVWCYSCIFIACHGWGYKCVYVRY